LGIAVIGQFVGEAAIWAAIADCSPDVSIIGNCHFPILHESIFIRQVDDIFCARF
jgi:hypothetical protein